MKESIRNDVNRVKGWYKKAKRTTGNVITGRHQIGESLPRESAAQRAERKTRMENGLARYANGRGSSVLKPGIVQGGGFYKGSKGVKRQDIARDRSAYGRPVRTLKPGIVPNQNGRKDYTNGYREKIGNDKSVWGRPIYRKKPASGKHQIGNDKSIHGRPLYGKRKPNRKVQGIRLGDIKSGAKRVRDLRKKNRKLSKERRFKRDRKRFSP